MTSDKMEVIIMTREGGEEVIEHGKGKEGMG
jgi:hypothetical protein